MGITGPNGINAVAEIFAPKSLEIKVDKANIKATEKLIAADNRAIDALTGQLESQLKRAGFKDVDQAIKVLEEFRANKAKAMASVEGYQAKINAAEASLGKLETAMKREFSALGDAGRSAVLALDPEKAKPYVSETLYRTLVDYKSKKEDLAIQILQAQDEIGKLHLDVASLIGDKEKAKDIRATQTQIHKWQASLKADSADRNAWAAELQGDLRDMEAQLLAKIGKQDEIISAAQAKKGALNQQLEGIRTQKQ